MNFRALKPLHFCLNDFIKIHKRYRPSSGTWYLLRTTAGFTGAQFGSIGDIPAPNAYIR